MMGVVDQAFPQLREVGAKTSVWKAPVSTISELFNHRFLVRNLIRREVRGRYRNAMLGYLWTVIEPALLAIVYWFLFVMLAGKPDEMYPVWVLLGVVTWGCFGKSLSATVNSLTGNARTHCTLAWDKGKYVTKFLGIIRWAGGAGGGWGVLPLTFRIQTNKS